MGNMAEELAARIEADGGDGLAGGATGTRDNQPAPPPPAAEPSRTDTGSDGRTPDTIPYTRFKEVNDQLSNLRPYAQFEELGYDPDSLGRLVNFEANYAKDPAGTVSVLVDNLDLPDSRKAALKELLGSPTAVGSNGAETPTEDDDTVTQLSPEVKEALDYVKQAKLRDSQQETEGQLSEVIDHWKRMDEADGLTGDKATPRHVMLMHISSLADGGRFATLEELAQASRKVYSDERDRLLGSAVQSSRSGSPARVPAGPPAAEAPRFKNIKEASKAALADIQAGRLPAMNLSNE